jgi:hypothetical protein
LDFFYRPYKRNCHTCSLFHLVFFHMSLNLRDLYWYIKLKLSQSSLMTMETDNLLVFVFHWFLTILTFVNDTNFLYFRQSPYLFFHAFLYCHDILSTYHIYEIVLSLLMTPTHTCFSVTQMMHRCTTSVTLIMNTQRFAP